MERKRFILLPLKNELEQEQVGIAGERKISFDPISKFSVDSVEQALELSCMNQLFYWTIFTNQISFHSEYHPWRNHLHR